VRTTKNCPKPEFTLIRAAGRQPNESKAAFRQRESAHLVALGGSVQATLRRNDIHWGSVVNESTMVNRTFRKSRAHFRGCFQK
jgi:hypothetical protein